MNQKRRRKKSRLLWRIIAILALLFALICAGIAVGIRIQVKRNAASMSTPAPEVTAIPSPAPTQEPEEEEVVIPIDFDYWQAINPEVYAYIQIPGTGVDYPILHDEEGDNSYYLKHCIDGTPGLPGCIFTENYNTTTFEDPVTVVYGHYVAADYSYFAQLHEFKDPEFFQENNKIFIYMPDRVLQYRVFSAYTYDDRHLMYYYNNFTDPQDRTDFIDSIWNVNDLGANIDTTMSPSADDTLLVLSTCTGAYSAPYRFLVVAVLEEVQMAG